MVFKPQTLNFDSGQLGSQLTFSTWLDNTLITIRVSDILAVVDMPEGKEFPADSGPVSTLYFGEHQVLVRDSRLVILAAIAALAPPLGDGYILIEDHKADDVQGGTFTSGAWRTRDLNVEVEDTSNLVTLAANQMTLEPGDYVIDARATFAGCFDNQVRLRDVDTSTTLLTGQNAYSASTHADAGFAGLQGRFSLSIQTVLEIQHVCAITRATLGFGTRLLLFEANVEVYTTVEMWSLNI